MIKMLCDPAEHELLQLGEYTLKTNLKKQNTVMGLGLTMDFHTALRGEFN